MGGLLIFTTSFPSLTVNNFPWGNAEEGTTLRAWQLSSSFFTSSSFITRWLLFRPTSFFQLSAFLRGSNPPTPTFYISLPLLMLNDSFILDSFAFIFLDCTVFHFYRLRVSRLRSGLSALKIFCFHLVFCFARSHAVRE